MNLVDILIAIGSIGLVISTLPTLVNKKAQVPRFTSSIPLAVILSYYIPLFIYQGLILTAITISFQALTWWLIAIFRPVRRPY